MTDQPRKTSDAPKKRRPAVPGSVAKLRLIEEVIAMAHNVPFDQITARKVTEAAELTLPAIARNFGSMEGLFVHVADVLFRRSIESDGLVKDLRLIVDDNFVLRTRLIAWMIAEGSDPNVFEIPNIRDTVTSFQAELGNVGSHTVEIWIKLLSLLVEGYIIFGDVHHTTEKDFADGVAMVVAIREMLPELEKRLGWKS